MSFESISIQYSLSFPPSCLSIGSADFDDFPDFFEDFFDDFLDPFLEDFLDPEDFPDFPDFADFFDPPAASGSGSGFFGAPPSFLDDRFDDLA